MLDVPPSTPVIVVPETVALVVSLDTKLPPEKPAGAEAVVVLVTSIVGTPRLTDPAGQLGPKVAVTALALVIEREQPPDPTQSPLHAVKVEFAFGVAVRVTVEPEAKLALHTLPLLLLSQLIPEGLLVTTPLPVPASVTVTKKEAATLNVA
jgi:hypothetical protein